jgi:hypothetical protein
VYRFAIVKDFTWPRVAQQAQCQGFAQEETKQSEHAGDENDLSIAGRTFAHVELSFNVAQAL